MSLAYNVPYESYPPSIYAPPVAPATGATAGIPGTFTPAGSTPPADVAGMAGLVASPLTAWTVGQYVQTRTSGAAGQSSWSGTSWVGGAAPVAADKASASPGDSFTPESSIIGSTVTQAAKLEGLGYVADPTTEWAAGEQITVNGYAFHWDGAVWQPGAAP